MLTILAWVIIGIWALAFLAVVLIVAWEDFWDFFWVTIGIGCIGALIWAIEYLNSL